MLKGNHLGCLHDILCDWLNLEEIENCVSLNGNDFCGLNLDKMDNFLNESYIVAN